MCYIHDNQFLNQFHQNLVIVKIPSFIIDIATVTQHKIRMKKYEIQIIGIQIPSQKLNL